MSAVRHAPSGAVEQREPRVKDDRLAGQLAGAGRSAAHDRPACRPASAPQSATWSDPMMSASGCAGATLRALASASRTRSLRAPHPEAGASSAPGATVVEREAETRQQQRAVARGRGQHEPPHGARTARRWIGFWLLFLLAFFDRPAIRAIIQCFRWPARPAVAHCVTRRAGGDRGGWHGRAGGFDRSSRRRLRRVGPRCARRSDRGRGRHRPLPRVADRMAPKADRGGLPGGSSAAADALGRPALAIAWTASCTARMPALHAGHSPGRSRKRRWCCWHTTSASSCGSTITILHEVILAADVLDPMSLVEDELLLTLPFAPHCERADCVVRTEAHVDVAASGKASPFAALGALKKATRQEAEAIEGIAERGSIEFSSGEAHGCPAEQEVAVEARHAPRARFPRLIRPLAVEPVTGEAHLRHHISPSGFYRGRKVVKTKADE